MSLPCDESLSTVNKGIQNSYERKLNLSVKKYSDSPNGQQNNKDCSIEEIHSLASLVKVEPTEMEWDGVDCHSLMPEVQIETSEATSEDNSGDGQNRKKLNCDHCGKVTLRKHLRVHNGKKSFNCEHCVKNFKSHVMTGYHETELLIAEVQKRPVLWDTSTENYKDKNIRMEAWTDVCRSLIENFNSKNKEEKKHINEGIKKKWKNLRDSYAKYMRAMTAKTGLAHRYKNWTWAVRMEFLQPFLGYSQSTLNFQIIEAAPEEDAESRVNNTSSPSLNEDVEATSSVLPESPIETSAKPSSSGTRNRKRPAQSNSTSVVDCFQHKKQTTDALETLFLGYARTVKNFSPKRQAITKMKIAEIIMQQEMEVAEEISHGPPSSTSFPPSFAPIAYDTLEKSNIRPPDPFTPTTTTLQTTPTAVIQHQASSSSNHINNFDPSDAWHKQWRNYGGAWGAPVPPQSDPWPSHWPPHLKFGNK